MTTYICLLVWIMIIWLITDCGKMRLVLFNRNNLKSNICLICAFQSAFVIMALRGESVGVDTANYKRYFTQVAQLEWSSLFSGGWDGHYFTTEIAYMVIEKIVSIFTNNAQWLIAICAAIYINGVYCFVKKYSQHTLMSIMSFLCIGSFLLAMNLMRQSVAVGLCCVAWIKLQKREYGKAILWIAMACTIHVSAIVFFLTIFFKIIPANKKNLIILALMSISFSIEGTDIVYRVIKFFPVYQSRYGRGRWQIAEANGIIILWLIIVIIMGILFFSIQWENADNHFIFEVILCSMTYLCINILGQSFDGLQRLSMYFQPFLIVLFEVGGKYLKKNLSKIYYTGVTVSMALLFLRMASSAQYQYFPFWKF